MSDKKLQIPQEMIAKILRAIRHNDNVEKDAGVYSRALEENSNNLNNTQKEELSKVVNIYNEVAMNTAYEMFVKLNNKCSNTISDSEQANHGKSTTAGNIFALSGNLYINNLPHYDQEKVIKKELYKITKQIDQAFAKNKGKVKESSNIKMFDRIKEMTPRLYKSLNQEPITLTPAENEVKNLIKDRYVELTSSKSLNLKDYVDRVNILYKSMGEDFNVDFNSMSSNILSEKFENDGFVTDNNELREKTFRSLKNVHEFLDAERVERSYSNNKENKFSKNHIVLGKLNDKVYDDAKMSEQNIRMNEIINLLYTYNLMNIDKEFSNPTEFDNEVHKYVLNKVKDKKPALNIYNQDVLKQAQDETYAEKFRSSRTYIALLSTLQMSKFLVNDKSNYLAIEKVLTHHISNSLFTLVGDRQSESELNVRLYNSVYNYSIGNIDIASLRKEISNLNLDVSNSKYNISQVTQNKLNTITDIIKDDVISKQRIDRLVDLSQISLNNTHSVKNDIALLFSVDKYVELSNNFLVDYAKLIKDGKVTLNENVSAPEASSLKGSSDKYLVFLNDISSSNGCVNFMNYTSYSDMAIPTEKSENQVNLSFNVDIRQDGVYEGQVGNLINLMYVNADVSETINQRALAYMDMVTNNKDFEDIQKIVNNGLPKTINQNLVTSQAIADQMSKIQNKVRNSHVCAKKEAIEELKLYTDKMEDLKNYVKVYPTRVASISENEINLKDPIKNVRTSIGLTISQNLDNLLDQPFENVLNKFEDISKEEYAKYGSILKELYSQSYFRKEKMDATSREKLYRKVMSRIRNSANTNIQRDIVSIILRNQKGLEFIQSEAYTSVQSRIYIEKTKSTLNKELKNAKSDKERIYIQGRIKDLETTSYRYTKIKSKMNEILADFLTNEVGLKDVTRENAVTELERYLLIKVAVKPLGEDLNSMSDKIAFDKSLNAIKEFEEKFNNFANNYKLNITESDIDKEVIEKMQQNSKEANLVKQYLDKESNQDSGEMIDKSKSSDKLESNKPIESEGEIVMPV